VSAPLAAGRVLPTLNEDGSRYWLRPRPSHGPKWRVRQVVAYGLMLLFFLIPHLRMRGRPLVLLDLPRREFTLLGYTFLPTDTLLLMLLLASGVLTIFLLTALFGRVWCGWACPQTVYMEFLFRPIERLLEGGRTGSLAIDRDPRRVQPRRLLKHVVYLALALFLAHTFLAYFVGVEQLAQWVRRSPVEHPTSFFVMALTTGMIFWDFAYFREQTCTIACPYGRLQSVLLDKSSLIVAYDPTRGEPRTKGRAKAAGAGDCIDCSACVHTCPTGIDIRNGLQMECIHCTQCADACDDIMLKVGKPVGLIRYSSQDALAGKPPRILRARTVLYPLAFTLFFGGFVFALVTRSPADVTLLGGLGAPFTTEANGDVVNQVRIKIANRTGEDHEYTIAYMDEPGARLIAPENPVRVAAGHNLTTTVFVVQPADRFAGGERRVRFRLSDGAEFSREFAWRLLGPED
jgi:cytochrome c oxidase accessory protein FixG